MPRPAREGRREGLAAGVRATGVRGGDGRGAGLGGPWAVRAPPVRPPPLCSRLPQSPPRRLSAPRRGPAPWPGPARLGGTCRGLRGGHGAGMLGSRGLAPRRGPWRRLGVALGKVGKCLPFGTGPFQAGSAGAGARGARVGSWAGTPSVARRPHPRPPLPCHRSLRALGPRQPGRALPTPLLPSSHPELCCPLQA